MRDDRARADIERVRQKAQRGPYPHRRFARILAIAFLIAAVITFCAVRNGTLTARIIAGIADVVILIAALWSIGAPIGSGQ
jgi:hypothetical protein